MSDFSLVICNVITKEFPHAMYNQTVFPFKRKCRSHFSNLEIYLGDKLIEAKNS